MLNIKIENQEMKNYLELDFRSGSLYEFSSTEKEGYEKYTSSTGNVTYRRYVKTGVAGKLKAVYISDQEGFGMQLRVIVENPVDWFMIKIPVFTSAGRMDSYLESLLAFLPNMDLGKEYRLFPYSGELEGKNGKTYTSRGFSVKEATVDGDGVVTVGEKVERYLKFIPKDVEVDPNDPTYIPKLDFVKGLNGKPKPSATSLAVQKEFMESLLQEQLERLDTKQEDSSTNTQEAPKEEAKKPVNTTTVPKSPIKKAILPKASAKAPLNVVADTDEDDDDVPF